MQNRRWTRLTNAFSKKWENHELMFALFVAWYNFCRPHMTLKTTPAVAAGLTGVAWRFQRRMQLFPLSKTCVLAPSSRLSIRDLFSGYPGAAGDCVE